MHSESEKAAIRAAVEQARAELAKPVAEPPKRRQRTPVVPVYAGPRAGSRRIMGNPVDKA